MTVRVTGVAGFIGEGAPGQKAKKNCLPMQNGDVLATHASSEALKRDVGLERKTQAGLTALSAGLPSRRLTSIMIKA